MLYMVVEHFREGDTLPVYRLLGQWTARWEDLMEFEITPVVTSAEAVVAVAPRL